MVHPSPSALGAGGRFFFGSLCLGTGALGVWQTRRFFEKQELIERRANDLQREPIAYREYYDEIMKKRASSLQESTTATTSSSATTPSPTKSFRRLALTGTFRHDCEIFVGPRGPPPGGSTGSGVTGVPSSGYFVITPFQIQNEGQSKQPESPSVVLVNRGWIPRNLLPHRPKKSESDESKDGTPSKEDDAASNIRGTGHHSDFPYRHDKHFDHHEHDHSLRDDLLLKEKVGWTRPRGTIQLTVVPTPMEEPRFMIAKHNVGNDTRPAIFFWYDVPSMIAVTKEDGLAIQSSTADAAATSTTTPSSNGTLVLLTQVDSNDEKQSGDKSKKAEMNWPLAPTSTSLIDGRIHPIMHAGYAVTWFGLCIAGMIMTRRLSTVPHHAAATAAKNGAASTPSPAGAASALKQAGTLSPTPSSPPTSR